MARLGHMETAERKSGRWGEMNLMWGALGKFFAGRLAW